MSIDPARMYDKRYRMDNLYYIVDRYGNNIRFEMNDVQKDVFDNFHNRNLILKARQLGMSTFAVLYLLDETLFNFNLSAGIVSYSLQHAQHIFKRIIGHALDNIPPEIRPLGIKQRSATEISFDNGSHLRVDTTLRGGTCQLVLVSEFGKTCARSPQKAEEIVAGTLNTLSQEGTVIIESTGEGNEGYFADMCHDAESRGNDNLSALDYKLFFYPWHKEKSYRVEQEITYPIELKDYLDKVQEESGDEINEYQRRWYAVQKTVLGDKLKQEFPSTVTEAFLSSSEAYYYADGLSKAYEEGRILSVSPYEALLPVYVAMDIGVNDLTAMTFFQVAHGEIRIIDYYEDNNKGVDFYVSFLLNDKKYIYHTIYLPHDAVKRDGIVVENTYAREFRKLLSHTNTNVAVLPKTDRNAGIYNGKTKVDRAVFHEQKTKKLIDHLLKYRKKWHEGTGRYLDEPLHDTHSNAADSFRYACQAISRLEASMGKGDAYEKHRIAVDSRRFRI